MNVSPKYVIAYNGKLTSGLSRWTPVLTYDAQTGEVDRVDFTSLGPFGEDALETNQAMWFEDAQRDYQDRLSGGSGTLTVPRQTSFILVREGHLK